MTFRTGPRGGQGHGASVMGVVIRDTSDGIAPTLGLEGLADKEDNRLRRGQELEEKRGQTGPE